MASTNELFGALTSTAAERKRVIAACPAPRGQIAKFEDAFFKMHGRAPKGAAERAPLTNTYMKYREWKRAIRDDAACRVQALCRGFRVRLMLSRSDVPSVVKYVSKYQGRNQHKCTGASLGNKSPSPIPCGSLPDVLAMSLAELRQRKQELKQQLKLYDVNFHRQHYRMPEKSEKEPVIHLYRTYNAYKEQISILEKGQAPARNAHDNF